MLSIAYTHLLPNISIDPYINNIGCTQYCRNACNLFVIWRVIELNFRLFEILVFSRRRMHTIRYTYHNTQMPPMWFLKSKTRLDIKNRFPWQKGCNGERWCFTCSWKVSLLAGDFRRCCLCDVTVTPRISQMSKCFCVVYHLILFHLSIYYSRIIKATQRKMDKRLNPINLYKLRSTTQHITTLRFSHYAPYKMGSILLAYMQINSHYKALTLLGYPC